MSADSASAAELRVRQVFADSIQAHEQFVNMNVSSLVAAADATSAALERGRKLLIFGNGGSAADSQHVAAELVGRFMRDRRPLAAVALTTDTSIVTSIANDYGYERVFARQIEALGASGDVVMGITTSGSSPNVLAALVAARNRGLTTIALTGRDGGVAGRAATIHINVPSESSARVQEVQRTILHVFCLLVEEAVLGAGEL